MANAKALTKLHKFHLILTDSSERDVNGASADVEDGVLVIRDAEREASVLYGPSQWRLCERSTKDE